jgi:SAM-dependent methyltransferase
MLLYACTIFTSAFLLFLVQPIIAKQILPWFGGSAAVWTTCLVFFQLALLAGYAYTDFTTRKLKPRTQVILHIALLLASLAVLPIVADVSWKPAGNEDPGARIIGLLFATIGLPYLLLSTTGPLVQAWFARSFPQSTVYRLFALSNLASMLALISYPFVFETWIATATQAYAWSAGYGLFAVLCATSAIYSLRTNAITEIPLASAAATAAAESPAPGKLDLFLWLALSAMGSWLLLAITNHITQNIASIPFLWLAPLTLYLLTFILCFDSDRWYRRAWTLGPIAIIVGFCAWGLKPDSDVTLNIRIAIPLYLAGLFASCMFFHGELAQMRPAPRYLTRFYLMVSLGGAIGGMFVGLIAPRIFVSYSELGLGFVVAAILAAITLRRMPILVWLTAIGVAGLCGFFWNKQLVQLQEDTRVMKRDFYGTLRTKDTGPETSDTAMRRLIHGVILHGEQYLKPEKRTEPTTYYGPDSGVGILIKIDNPQNQKVGVIGLGTGTLAAWGKPGDTYRFYDINPQVIKVAKTEFSFLGDSKANIETVLGDARLSLERDEPQNFDVLVVDAFSSDAIPVHLITREAVATYLRHLKPSGGIAFHVTNRFLQLAPVVKQIADTLGLYTALVVDDADNTDFSKTDWVIVTRDKTLLDNPALAGKTTPIDEIKGLKLWTDDFSSLYQILK